ncbi:MFS transporter [Rhodococcus sp. 1163]|uniref:MFS transporter n=1 Tax=unclassified Rhodococcus (in: high G+C Gram-positive bacteria) TaxID=192944 RepID=UPI000A0280CA|nr:MFS transporter [Rhodococcus sp. 1163]ORI15015.1 MFS transporter [Rhodococcus sp. 1163]
MDSNEVGGRVHDLPDDTSKAQLRKVALSSLLGTALEYYDFLLYSTMAALVFGDVFFPGESSVVSTIAAFGTLAVGYVARPLGGILFGHFGDRFGRKHILIVTMGLMGVASFLIGLLPSYAAIGVTAPILLVLLRILQGLAVGGEWGGAALMVVEHADAENRGKWAGIMNLGSPIGFLMSTVAVAIVSLLPDESLQSWGWRIPFLLSALLVVVGLYVRTRVTESPVFQQAAERAETENAVRTPLSRLIRSPRPVILACAAGIAPFALTALMTSHIIAYATGIGYDKSKVIQVLILLSVVALVAIPLASTLSDRIGRRTVVFIGATGAIIFAFPLYMLINTGSIALMAAGLVFAQILQNMMFAPLVPLLSEMFGTTVRYTGASLGYQGASLIGAGFTPLIASVLLAGFGGSSVPLSLIIIITAGVSIGALAMIKETRGRDLTTIDVESSPATPVSTSARSDLTR